MVFSKGVELEQDFENWQFFFCFVLFLTEMVKKASYFSYDFLWLQGDKN